MTPRLAHRVRAAALAALLLLTAWPTAATADDDAVAARVLGAARRHAVLVSFTFQRDAAREETGATPPDPRGLAARYRFWRLSWRVPGIVAGGPRQVIVADPWISPTAIESVEIIEADGRRTPARLHGLLPNAEGAVVVADADLMTPPVAFATDADTPTPERLFAASVAEGADGPEVWAEPLASDWRRAWDAEDGVGFGRPTASFEGVGASDDPGERRIDLVVDAQGTPWGFRFGDALDPDGRWRGAAVLGQEAVPYAALADMAVQAATDGTIHRVNITYRTTSRHDRQRTPFGMGSRGTAEEEFWGLAVAPDLLLVPSDLDDEQVRRIVAIRLGDAPEGSRPAAESDPAAPSYAGRVRGYRAFLVRVPNGGLVPVGEVSPAPARGALLLLHRVARRGGARRDSLDPNRVLGHSRGYGDRRFLAAERPVQPGVFLRDARGTLVGFTAVLDPADRDFQIGSTRAGGRSPFPPVAVIPAEAGGFETLLADPDTQVMPQEEVESHRQPWLGIEGDDLDEGVAELLDVSLPTRDGRRGLIVVRVYPESPAARAGLAEGDVLLAARRLSPPGGPETDLRSGGARSFFPSFFPGADAPAPWRTRENAITRLLQEWGLGTEYELLWLRNGKEERSKLAVEMAPPDFSSAPREFDEGTGLEVRDLTYEVRAALRMPPDAAGVVVGRVEQGTKAAQARLQANEIILEVDGVAIADAAAFQTRLDEARRSGQRTLRLAVRRLGRTRLVDLEPGAAGDEAEEDE